MADNIDVTPGTGATVATEDTGGAEYQKIKLVDGTAASVTPLAVVAEDAAAAGGEGGIMPLAVRRDAKASSAGTTGDFATLNTNAVGDVRVDGGHVTYIDVTLTCDTSILAVGDIIADSQIVAGVVRANDAGGVLHSICMIDIDDQAQAVDLVFMRTSTSLGTENAAISISAANLASGLIGTVSVAAADYDDFINAQAATLTNVGLSIDPVSGADDIYIGAICRSGTPTYTASGLQLRLGFIAD